jgi:hypothetical protein
MAIMLIPVSWGELIDKITILEIKQHYIISKEALINIKKELEILNNIFRKNTDVEEKIEKLKSELYDVNHKLWVAVEDIRKKESLQEFDLHFIQLSRDVYSLNDERFKIKKSINNLLLSEIAEEKSYFT